MNKFIQKYFFRWIMMSIIFISCNPKQPLKIVKIEGFSMGTTYHISYLFSEERSFQYQVDSVLSDLNNSLSTFIPTSTISKVNQADSISKTLIDEYFIKVYEKAVEVYHKTDGAFNPTIMPLVNAWGFGFENKLNIDSALIDSLLKLVNMEGISVDTLPSTNHSSPTPPIKVCLKKHSNIMLDFSAIAKGYGVDVVSEYLESIAVDNYLVEIGGEIRARGKNDKGKCWTIGIDKPTEDTTETREINAIIELNNRAIATSGNYRNYYIKDGKHYAHIIDPTTGYPVNHNLLSVSVFANDCMTADAYATAFMVLGVDKSKALAESNPEIEAFFIYSDSTTQFNTTYTKGLTNKIEVVDK